MWGLVGQRKTLCLFSVNWTETPGLHLKSLFVHFSWQDFKLETSGKVFVLLGEYLWDTDEVMHLKLLYGPEYKVEEYFQGHLTSQGIAESDQNRGPDSQTIPFFSGYLQFLSENLGYNANRRSRWKVSIHVPFTPISHGNLIDLAASEFWKFWGFVILNQ